MRRSLQALMLVAIIGCGPALSAQDFNGTLETRLDWFWQSPELLPLPQTFEGRIEGKVGNPDLPTARYSAKLKFEFDPTTAATTVDLGEAWIKLFAGPFDLSFGNQVVAWGCTDVYTPTDVVNPLDLGLPVDRVKMPVPLALLVYNGNGLTVDLVAQPFWIAAVQPGKPWLPDPSLPAGFTVTSQTMTSNIPGFNWENAAYGVHLKASLGILQGLDLGATVHRGRLATPRATVVVTPTGPSTITVATTLDYDRFTLVGADLVLGLGGGFLLKTEWGYTTLRDSSFLEPEAGAASLQGVSGLEYGFGPVQFIGEYVFDWAKGTAATGDTIRHEFVGIASWEIDVRSSFTIQAIHSCDGDGMVAPQFSYTIADGLQFNCGIFLFYGDPGTTYGAWKNNSLGRVSLKYSF